MQCVVSSYPSSVCEVLEATVTEVTFTLFWLHKYFGRLIGTSCLENRCPFSALEIYSSEDIFNSSKGRKMVYTGSQEKRC